MNKNEFFEAVKNGVLENLKKTDDTPEATINKVTKINNVIYNRDRDRCPAVHKSRKCGMELGKASENMGERTACRLTPVPNMLKKKTERLSVLFL